MGTETQHRLGSRVQGNGEKSTVDSAGGAGVSGKVTSE